MKTILLNNGVEMPMLGFGVFQVPNNDQCEQVVLDALSAGYRLLDTASAYQNEEAVGSAIRKCGIPREELFITTKAFVHEMGYEKTKKAFEESLKKLGLEYLDLYLIHMPFGDYYGSWRAMEELYKSGKVRAIGVSNFNPDRLIDLCNHVEIKPAINQLETHPYFQRSGDMKIMEELGVQIEAWGPFAEGKQNIFENETLLKIAHKYGKSTAQVMLRWNIERGVIVIPKSVRNSRIQENFDIWDFNLTQEDMNKIAEMDTGHHVVLDLYDPSEIGRIYNDSMQIKKS